MSGFAIYLVFVGVVLLLSAVAGLMAALWRHLVREAAGNDDEGSSRCERADAPRVLALGRARGQALRDIGTAYPPEPPSPARWPQAGDGR